MYWIKRTNGNWSHKTPLKMILNPILRFVQFYTNKPYIIVSHVELIENSHPRFKRYGIMYVEH